MQNHKTIFVTGATGNQGGAVATSLINRGFKIKALVRNPDAAAAKMLSAQHIEIVKGDLNDVASYRDYLRDVDGIYSVQTFMNGIDVEIAQGKNLANLAKEYGVPHFLYSSVAGADWHTGIPHFESKLIIENHIKGLGLPFTIIRPASFFENFLIPQVKSRIAKGKLSNPVRKDKVQQFISVMDIGEFAASIFLNKEKFIGNAITIASEEMDMQEAAQLFSRVLGKDIQYQKLPMLITRLLMGKSLYKMFKWINENDSIFVKNISEFKKENPQLISLEHWIKMHTSHLTPDT